MRTRHTPQNSLSLKARGAIRRALRGLEDLDEVMERIREEDGPEEHARARAYAAKLQAGR